MSDDPFLARLEARANAVRDRPRTSASPALSTAPAAAPGVDRSMLAFWQHPVARAYIERRISGAPDRSPLDLLIETASGLPPGPGMSIRVTDPRFEATLIERGVCTAIVGIVGDERQLPAAKSRIPGRVGERLALRAGDPLTVDPGSPLRFVTARSALHRYEDPDRVIRALVERLAPGGLLLVDEFIGPAQHQWTDDQIAIVTRLLRSLPAELLVDLTATDGRKKDSIARRSPAAFAASHPAEAVGSEETVAALDAHLERVVFRPYGGAVFHQFFARIMGNFAARPDVVGLVMEIDAVLCDYGVLGSDYLWAIYRRA